MLNTKCRPLYSAHLLLLFTSFLRVQSSTSLEEAKIKGDPSLKCSASYAILSFNTTEPFQGKIVVLGKNGRLQAACVYEFSYNLHLNATAFIDLTKCAQTYFASNGSRIFHAHVDVSFHPLVMTNTDRVYHVQCVDNAFIKNVLLSTDSDNSTSIANCSMSTRPASRWEATSIFRVGDSVVHEWNCAFDKKEHGKFNTFLTTCNAISRVGEIIHLVDENGCIIDPELLGELVYNNYTARISSRSRIFRFPSGEMFRIECHVKMCIKKTTCGVRSTPPRCAFTKEDFQKRFEPNATRHGTTNFSPVLLSDGSPFDYNILVTSDWMAVKHNHFTDVDALQERFYLYSELNRSLSDVVAKQPKHFLASISYRVPDGELSLKNSEWRDESIEGSGSIPVRSASQAGSFGSRGEIAPPPPPPPDDKLDKSRFSSLFDLLESASFPELLTKSTAPWEPPRTIATTTENTVEAKPSLQRPSKGRTITVTQKIPVVLLTSSNIDGEPTTTLRQLESKHSNVIVFSSASTRAAPARPASTPSSSSAVEKPTSKRPFSRVPLNRHTDPPHVDNVTRRNELRNRNDWRLDDGHFNDTEVSSSLNCTNNSQILPIEGRGLVCRWSGLEHFLLIWSLFSFVAWVLLVAFLLYHYNARRPEWTEFRQRTDGSSHERASPSTALTCVLPQEHPWLHPDAFERRRPSFRSSASSGEVAFHCLEL